MNEKVSVIVSTYNRGEFLSNPLESLTNQTFKNFEALVMDEVKTTDNTEEIVRKYQKMDDRIKYVRKNMGSYPKALNVGIDMAKGDYIAILDSDDAYYPTTLEEMVKAIDKRPEMALAYSDMIFEKDGNFEKEWVKPDFNRDLLLDWMYIGHAKLFRKEPLLSIGGFDESMRLVEDYDMALRLSEVSDFLHVNKTLYKYNHHNKRISVLEREKQNKAAKEAVMRAKIRRGLL